VKLSNTYNLKAVRPELAKQWHPTKNRDLTPDKVTPSSTQKVWWMCQKGHEWETIISYRNNGSGCPYCTDKIVSKENNLSVISPEIAKQWHPIKNGTLTPDKVKPGSRKKVWWKCDKGHEWQAVINSRKKISKRCPLCSNRRASKEYNLSTSRPEIAKQWHPVKNADLTPDKVTPGSNKKVWWICDKGHVWKTAINNRNSGRGCPKCASNKATKEHNLMILRPYIAGQWHPKKNGCLTPEDVTPMSTRTVWWLCDKGHHWPDVIRARTKYGNDCPYCYGLDRCKEYNLSALHPDIVHQWHPTRNSQLTPEDVTPGSKKKVWWVCHKGHEWRTTINTRTSGNNCPYCHGLYPSADYNLLVSYPKIVRQWHPVKNRKLKPTMVTQSSRKKVWWKCDKGHEWQATVVARSKRNTGCPYCFGRKPSKEYNLLKIHPEIVKQWHLTKNRDLNLDKFTPGSKKKVWWICDKGHEWQAYIKNRSIRGQGCPYCAGRKISKKNNLLKIYPEIAKQWHPTKNRDLTPDKVTPGSNKKVWWKCNKGHEWQAIIINRTKRSSGCPYCVGKKASKDNNFLKIYPEIAKQWHPTKNRYLTPDKVTPGSDKKVWWICDKGHEWQAIIRSRSKLGSGCPYCAGQKK
jgi:hypothetical protein